MVDQYKTIWESVTNDHSTQDISRAFESLMSHLLTDTITNARVFAPNKWPDLQISLNGYNILIETKVTVSPTPLPPSRYVEWVNQIKKFNLTNVEFTKYPLLLITNYRMTSDMKLGLHQELQVATLEFDIYERVSTFQTRLAQTIESILAKLTGQTPENIRRYYTSQDLAASLRQLYQGRCQVCGFSSQTDFGLDVSELHFLDSVAQGGGPDAISNLICLCPNHHRIIEALGWRFDPDLKGFVSPSGTKLMLTVNLHL